MIVAANTGDIAVVCLLVVMAGLWAVAFIYGLWLVRDIHRWRRELDRRGEIPFRWVTLDSSYAWTVWRRLLWPPGEPSELEVALRIRLLRATRAGAAFMGLGLIAVLIRYL
jgi:hypothetical protein